RSWRSSPGARIDSSVTRPYTPGNTSRNRPRYGDRGGMMHELRLSGGAETSHPALEALADGFLSIDGSWRVAYCNAAAERMLGVSREEVLGAVLWERLPW